MDGLNETEVTVHGTGETSETDLAVRRLPLNRKERFYTGTVLPMVTAANGFHDLHRLLGLCGLADVKLGDPSELQFFTEYSFAESVYTAADRASFSDRPTNADTPDLVILGPDWLLAVEAKMFHRPNAASLNAQHDRQSKLVAYWQFHFKLEPKRVRHVLLLPQTLHEAIGNGLHADVVTWEELLSAYSDISEPHWLQVLHEALSSYQALASKDSVWGQNAECRLTGSQVLAAYEAGNEGAAWVGRKRGLDGPEFMDDLISGGWKDHSYEVRSSPPPGSGKNWFSIEEFAARVTAEVAAASEESSL